MITLINPHLWYVYYTVKQLIPVSGIQQNFDERQKFKVFGLVNIIFLKLQVVSVESNGNWKSACVISIPEGEKATQIWIS